MLDKALIIYKGDQYTSYIYLGLSLFFGISAALLFVFTLKIGWFFLAIGLTMLAVFSAGKAIYVYFKAKDRILYFQKQTSLEGSILDSEIQYNQQRLLKKGLNRRRYLYTLLGGFFLLVGGIVFGEKGWAIGSFVPVLLYAGIEFSAGLLSEFRLWEYQRQLEKHQNNP
ncbi:MAG TPA: hypothetical protein PLQ57_00745 [Saprospiraceae bacterium]|nr:hypothetical protein [Saprospiraceae bacterium]HRG64197.1 hypothetical protein [Saprospiraceae bacterium]